MFYLEIALAILLWSIMLFLSMSFLSLGFMYAVTAYRLFKQ